jgi:hypothetical protein
MMPHMVKYNGSKYLAIAICPTDESRFLAVAPGVGEYIYIPILKCEFIGFTDERLNPTYRQPVSLRG